MLVAVEGECPVAASCFLDTLAAAGKTVVREPSVWSCFRHDPPFLAAAVEAWYRMVYARHASTKTAVYVEGTPPPHLQPDLHVFLLLGPRRSREDAARLWQRAFRLCASGVRVFVT